jgi:hypothetical protein
MRYGTLVLLYPSHRSYPSPGKAMCLAAALQEDPANRPAYNAGDGLVSAVSIMSLFQDVRRWRTLAGTDTCPCAVTFECASAIPRVLPR